MTKNIISFWSSIVFWSRKKLLHLRGYFHFHPIFKETNEIDFHHLFQKIEKSTHLSCRWDKKQNVFRDLPTFNKYIYLRKRKCLIDQTVLLHAFWLDHIAVAAQCTIKQLKYLKCNFVKQNRNNISFHDRGQITIFFKIQIMKKITPIPIRTRKMFQLGEG